VPSISTLKPVTVVVLLQETSIVGVGSEGSGVGMGVGLVVGFDVGEAVGEGVGAMYDDVTFTRVISFDPVSSMDK
jgi:hypothetical protein